MQTKVENHGHRLATETVVSTQELTAFAIHDCHCVTARECRECQQGIHGSGTLEGKFPIATAGAARFRDMVESSDEWANVSRIEWGLDSCDPFLQSLSFNH